MATQVHHEIQTAIPSEIPLTLIPVPVEPGPVSPAKVKKKLVRRSDRDRSQIMRRSFQGGFLLLNVWISSIFYFWVRQFEPGGAPTSLHRPAGVEGWLPIAGLMNLRYFALTHHVPALHPAGMFLLIAFLAMSFLFRKAFCSWLCPVGTISEYLWRARAETLPAELPSAALAGYRTARAEISAAWLLRVGCHFDGGG